MKDVKVKEEEGEGVGGSNKYFSHQTKTTHMQVYNQSHPNPLPLRQLHIF